MKNVFRLIVYTKNDAAAPKEIANIIEREIEWADEKQLFRRLMTWHDRQAKLYEHHEYWWVAIGLVGSDAMAVSMSSLKRKKYAAIWLRAHFFGAWA